MNRGALCTLRGVSACWSTGRTRRTNATNGERGGARARPASKFLLSSGVPALNETRAFIFPVSRGGVLRSCSPPASLFIERNSQQSTEAILSEGARGLELHTKPLSATTNRLHSRSDHPGHGKQADVVQFTDVRRRKGCKDQCLRRIAFRARRCPTSCRRPTLSPNRHSLRHRPTRSDPRRSLACPVRRLNLVMTDIREGLVYSRMMGEMVRSEGNRRNGKAPWTQFSPL